MIANRLIAFLACLGSAGMLQAETTTVIQHGPAELRRGTLEDAGANTYVSASGGFQTIHRWDLNRDGEIDLVFSQDHNAHYAPDAMIYWSDADGPHSLLPELPELRSPYTLVKHTEQALKRVSWLPSFGGGRCVIADLNNDGYVDIVSGNMMHNFRQDMPAYIYWGGPDGFRESDRTILPAYIASGIAVGDFNEDGLPDIAATPVEGFNYPTILCQNNSLITVGDETWIYHGRWRNVAFQQLARAADGSLNIARNYWGEVGLAKIPRDRWGALGLWHDRDTGSVWTAPVTLTPAIALKLNASGLTGLTIDVADAKFAVLDGYTAGTAKADNGDGFDAPVTWSGADLAALAGRTVRFRINFARAEGVEPRLFAATLGK